MSGAERVQRRAVRAGAEEKLERGAEGRMMMKRWGMRREEVWEKEWDKGSRCALQSV